MADRVFAGVILVIALAYTVIAFTIIKAPFQYDPLGPESWPRILGVLASLCCAYLVARPDVEVFAAARRTLIRLATVIALLVAYAWLYEPAGFLIATWGFAAIFAFMLGATPLNAVFFGGATGIVGYFACIRLLELNLPAGLIEPFL